VALRALSGSVIRQNADVWMRMGARCRACGHQEGTHSDGEVEGAEHRVGVEPEHRCERGEIPRHLGPLSVGDRVVIATRSNTERSGHGRAGHGYLSVVVALLLCCADVFVEVLTADVVEDGDSPRATLLVHTPEAALHEDSDEPGAYVDAGDTGVPIANETVRRLACDAIRQTVVEDSADVPIKLGRRTRTVSAHIFRLLKHRDRHCRAPGCTRTRGLHAHHLVHWADGGETDLDNLILLCGRHHRLLHEHHWRICGRPSQPETSEFRRPGGRVITPYRPLPLAVHVRERLLVTT
jgi:HNH endonuclease/Domain of unknown function (DUF222)